MENKLVFNEEKHEYTLNGKKLISVTQLMQKHKLAPSYAGVSTEVLQAKAERGTLIHKEIEDFNKSGAIGFTSEMLQFKEYVEENNIKVVASELQLHNDIVAGTCDLILNYGNGFYTIADIKTTYQLHLESVSWQLSIYAYLTGNLTIKKGQAFHFNKEGQLNVVDISLKPYEEIEELMECERKGEIFNSKKDIDLNIVNKLVAALKKKDEIDKEIDELKNQLFDPIKKCNGYSNDEITISYVKASTSKSFDSKKFEKEQPELYNKYLKDSNKKESMSIKLKKGE